MDDNYYINFVKNTKFLSETTKKIYLKKYNIIQNEIFDNKSIHYILFNFNKFIEKLDKYASGVKGRIDETLGTSARNSFIMAILALFHYNQQLKEEHKDIYEEWIKIKDIMQKPLTELYNSNAGTLRQQNAFIEFIELCKIRDKLKYGSIERLLLSMYTKIPPLRADYGSMRIITNILDVENTTNDENYMILHKDLNYICLQKYKTFRIYGVLNIDLPNDLVDEIKKSIELYPRNYLFVSAKSNEPYSDASFTKFANRLLKKITNNEFFSLCTLRHSYISTLDLNMTGTDKTNIANKMAHSVDTQRKYVIK